MKIVHKKSNNGRLDYDFDNGAWVSIDDEGLDWEYMSDADNEDSYCSGMLIWDNGAIVDFDGVFELPLAVKLALFEAGFILNLE